ncbi:uncharacterized protein ACJ7VT_012261 [Polymixia lowei]
MNNFLTKFIKLLDSSSASDYHGLTNQGATCYLNSVLQVLFLTKDFREAVGRGGQDSTTIDSHLERLFANLWSRTADTHCIAKILGITEVYEQHDVAEYFEKILHLSSPEASQMFKGCLRYRTTCSSCQNQSDLDALFWSLPLSMEDPGHQTYSVKKGLEAFFMPSEVSGDNKVYCDKCRAKADATIECNMTRHPEILTLLLKRFEFDYETMCYVKLTCYVDVPQTLQTESCTYDLYALVDHIGSLKGGHYTAMIKSYETGEWYHFDDAYVTMVRPPTFNSGGNATRSHNAYLLMYQKVKSPHSEIINGANQEAHFVNPDAVTVGTHDLTEGGEDCISRTHLKDDVPDGYRDMRQVGSCEEVLPHRDNVTVRSCEEVLPHRDNVTVRLTVSVKLKDNKMKRLHEANSDNFGNSPVYKYNGLRNRGSTCYLNCVLQVFFMTKDFREAVERHCRENAHTEKIDRHLETLFNDLKAHQTDTYEITSKLGIEKVYEQRDAAEYLEKILSMASPEASQIFHGQLTHRTTCSGCRKHTDADGPFWSLHLPMMDRFNRDGNYSVLEGLEEFLRPSTVSGNDQMYCDVCDSKADATIKCMITDYPEVLVLLLKRFEFDYYYMDYVKIDGTVDVPDTLPTQENQTYEIYAIVNHFGSLKGGHYSATIKSQDVGSWYEFNDSRVAQLDPQPFQEHVQKSSSAYLLIYRKKKTPAPDTSIQEIEQETSPEEHHTYHDDERRDEDLEETKTRGIDEGAEEGDDNAGVFANRHKVGHEETESRAAVSIEKAESMAENQGAKYDLRSSELNDSPDVQHRANEGLGDTRENLPCADPEDSQEIVDNVTAQSVDTVCKDDEEKIIVDEHKASVTELPEPRGEDRSVRQAESGQVKRVEVGNRDCKGPEGVHTNTRCDDVKGDLVVGIDAAKRGREHVDIRRIKDEDREPQDGRQRRERRVTETSTQDYVEDVKQERGHVDMIRTKDRETLDGRQRRERHVDVVIIEEEERETPDGRQRRERRVTETSTQDYVEDVKQERGHVDMIRTKDRETLDGRQRRERHVDVVIIDEEERETPDGRQSTSEKRIIRSVSKTSTQGNVAKTGKGSVSKRQEVNVEESATRKHEENTVAEGMSNLKLTESAATKSERHRNKRKILKFDTLNRFKKRKKETSAAAQGGDVQHGSKDEVLIERKQAEEGDAKQGGGFSRLFRRPSEKKKRKSKRKSKKMNLGCICFPAGSKKRNADQSSE